MVLVSPRPWVAVIEVVLSPPGWDSFVVKSQTVSIRTWLVSGHQKCTKDLFILSCRCYARCWEDCNVNKDNAPQVCIKRRSPLVMFNWNEERNQSCWSRGCKVVFLELLCRR